MVCRSRIHGLEVSLRTGRPAVPSQEWRLTLVVRGERVTVKKKVMVHSFNMGDVEDPYLYAGGPLWQWQNSEQGRWVMENTLDRPIFYCETNPSNFGYRVAVYAMLADEALTYFELKYGGNKRP